jgi:hypothetical protein
MFSRGLLVLTVLGIIGCSSQPRFIHHGGDPEQIFDNKTAQDCWAGPVQKDDGIAANEEAYKSYQDAVKKYEEAWARDSEQCLRALDKLPRRMDGFAKRPFECSDIDRLERSQLAMLNLHSTMSDREDRLREHPEEQKIIHVHGLPYCSELK